MSEAVSSGGSLSGGRCRQRRRAEDAALRGQGHETSMKLLV
jgi:hypothetical protein